MKVIFHLSQEETCQLIAALLSERRGGKYTVTAHITSGYSDERGSAPSTVRFEVVEEEDPVEVK